MKATRYILDHLGENQGKKQLRALPEKEQALRLTSKTILTEGAKFNWIRL